MNGTKDEFRPRDLASPFPMPVATSSTISRREFLALGAASVFLRQIHPKSQQLEVKNGIPYRRLGRTRENVSLIGLGGYHLGKQADPQESIRIIRTGLDEGVNFLDNWR